jgi:hypothetical protein
VWLALCEPHDEAGLWAVAGLRHLGVEPLEIVLPDELAIGAGLVHRIDAGGAASVELVTRRGVRIRSGEVRGVLNRLTGVPEGALDRLEAGDRDYVAEELTAALASWLGCLPCPVLNRPSPALLCGPWRWPAQWRWLAAHVGLPARAWRLASWDEPEPPEPAERVTVVVVGEEVTGAVPDELAAGCRALARAAGAALLGITLARDPGGEWGLEDATPLPDLRHGGRPALEALRRDLGA